MPRIAYIEKKFYGTSVKLIAAANVIIEEYRQQGFQLTLRQLYYQFVSRDLIANSQKEYKRLGSVINDARLAGLIDWDSIEDRTRNLRALPHWDTPQQMIDSALSSYRRDKWEDQNTRVEVWIEKDALAGVIEPICNEVDVPFFACRGYTSQSEQWAAGQRFAGYVSQGLRVVLLHFGDHDPSGIDMTRDNKDRLTMFVEHHAGDGIEVRRLALNMAQIEEHNPPPNPVKLTDSRAGGYQDNYGDESWELDALEPRIIRDLIAENVAIYRDDELWNKAKREEARERALFDKLKRHWPAVAKDLRKRK